MFLNDERPITQTDSGLSFKNRLVRSARIGIFKPIYPTEYLNPATESVVPIVP